MITAATAEFPFSQGAEMPQQWFIQTRSGEKGPFTSLQLEELAGSGRIKPNTKIRRGDSTTS